MHSIFVNTHISIRGSTSTHREKIFANNTLGKKKKVKSSICNEFFQLNNRGTNCSINNWTNDMNGP